MGREQKATYKLQLSQVPGPVPRLTTQEDPKSPRATVSKPLNARFPIRNESDSQRGSPVSEDRSIEQSQGGASKDEKGKGVKERTKGQEQEIS